MKKIIALVLCAALLAIALCGCGGAKDDKKIVVAASSTPHAEILEQCKKLMADKGYTLEIMVMDDYVTPNNATESGDVDANYFQHTPYLDDFNTANGTHLVSVAKVHYEPYGIYKGTSDSLTSIPDGAKIAVPNDSTNEARALMLLAANGLITLPENAGLTVTKKDIVANPHNYDIVEVEAALIPGMLDEVAVAVINGNYAINAGLKVSQALAVEDANSTAAQTYANILVVKEGNEKNAAVLALIEALQSETIQNYINATYDKAVIPIK